MEDIQKYTALVNIGELFSGWSHKKSEKIVKPKNKIQELVWQKFIDITGLDVPHREFKNLVATFCKKLKTNKGRKDSEIVFCDWFQKYVPVDVDSKTVEVLEVLDLVKIKDAKHSIQKEFVDRIGIIDFVKQGKGRAYLY